MPNANRRFTSSLSTRIASLLVDRELVKRRLALGIGPSSWDYVLLWDRDAGMDPLVPALRYDPCMESPPPGTPAADFDRAWVREHLADERRKASLLGEIREAIFGAQDGLVSTLGVVSAFAGATGDRTQVLIAGIATGLAGVFSMAAGEYMSSKSQREIFAAQIAGEREEVAERPGEAEAEMAYMFEERPAARRGRWAGTHPRRPSRCPAQDDGREGAGPHR